MERFNYKKIIKSQKLRFAILRALSFIPDKWMLSLQYYLKLGRRIDFKNPKRFTEKIQVYKTGYRNELLHRCVDKYDVRQYVESLGLADILNESYGIYEDCRSIDLDSLPESFVVKTTDGGGGENIMICKDKSVLEKEALYAELLKWKNKKDINAGREWAYTGIRKSRYIVEKLLVNTENPEVGIADYKFFCFNGQPEVIVYDTDRYVGHKRNFYDTDWNNLNVSSDCPQCDRNVPRPEGLGDMLKVAAELSKEFPFVRVDLYYVEGRVIFGELTFYPWSGYVQFLPDSFDFELGNMFDLSFMSEKI